MIAFCIVIFEILVSFLLQSAVFPFLPLADCTPDIMMIVCVAVAFAYGKLPGMFTGLCCGFLLDCSIGGLIGVYSLIYLLIGFGCGYAHFLYVKHDYTLPVLLLGICELFYNFMYYVMEFLLRGRLSISYYFVNVILPRTVYTVAVGVVLYVLFALLLRLGMRRRNSVENGRSFRSDQYFHGGFTI